MADADKNEDIGDYKVILFVPHLSSEVKTKKHLEMIVGAVNSKKDKFYAAHFLPSTKSSGGELIREEAENVDEAMKGVFLQMQRKLHDFRKIKTQLSRNSSCQKMYLESVIDMPKSYNPYTDN